MSTRQIRVETRSRQQNDLKRVMLSTAKVRRWEKKWVNVEETSMKSFRWMPIEDEEALDSRPTKSKLMRMDNGFQGEHQLVTAPTMQASRQVGLKMHAKSPTRNTVEMEDPFDIVRVVTDQIVKKVAQDDVLMEC